MFNIHLYVMNCNVHYVYHISYIEVKNFDKQNYYKELIENDLKINVTNSIIYELNKQELNVKANNFVINEENFDKHYLIYKVDILEIVN